MNKKTTQKQISSLIKLQLVNLYGVNIYRNTKDPKEKKKKFWLGVAYALVAIIMMSYIGGMSYGYVYLGLGDILPAYLIMLASLIILVFSIFKAGSVIFQKNSYDILSSLPIKSGAIVISRFVRLYIENLIIAFGVMMPASMVYGILVKPAWTYYVIGFLVTVFIPLLPITISVFVGALVVAISSRAKHKNLVSVSLALLLVVGIMVGSIYLSTFGEDIDITAIQNLLNLVLGIISKLYPPALWLGQAMLTGDFLASFVCLSGEVAVFAFVMWLVSINYKWMSESLYSTSAKHNYKMEKLEKSYKLGALYRRELKRYFSSSVYVTNTIVSPFMGILFAITMFFMSADDLQSTAINLYEQSGIMLQMRNMFPMALAVTFCIMPITAVSISMEGKQWWIVKTLPIRTKELLDSKLLMNLTVTGPFCLLASLLVVIAQKPSLMEAVWIFLVPLVAMLFSLVFGQTMNLKLAVFDWENEISVVKQSTSAFVGGILPFFAMIPATMAVMIVPTQYINLCMLAFCLIAGGVTVVLYRKNCKVNLMNI